MAKEISRDINAEGKVVIIYDDGSRETLKSSIPQKPSSRDTDADNNPAERSGHVFDPQEIEQ